MIQVENLSVVEGGRALLRDVSLHVPPGGKAALGGDSGAGKTTLLRVLVGQLRPTAGRVRIAGRELSPATIAEVRAALCYVPQSFAFFEDDRVDDFLRLPFRFRANRARTPDPARVTELLARFRLPADVRDARVGDVSGGERQRLALVRALLLERRLLLLDEATAALDAANRDLVADAVLGLPALTVLAVTHDPAWWARSELRITLRGGAVAAVEGPAAAAPAAADGTAE